MNNLKTFKAASVALPVIRSKYFEVFLILFLLIFHVILAVTSIKSKSPTFDEPLYVAGGVSCWKENEYLMLGDVNFPQRWLAIPMIFDSEIKVPPFKETIVKTSSNWSATWKFLYESGNDYESIFFRARMMILILSVLLGLLVYFWSREIFGRTGGFISLVMYCFSPSILAHCRLANGDMVQTLLFALVTFALWRLMQRMTFGRLGISAVLLGLLFLGKMSALFIVPIFFILIAIRLYRKRPLPVSLFHKKILIRKQRGQLIFFIVAGIFFGIVIYTMIWASYGFRFKMLKESDTRENQFVQKCWQTLLQQKGIVVETVELAKRYKILPEAYLYGFLSTYFYTRSRNAFLCGYRRNTGWWYYFPFCFLVKTPIPSLILFLLAGSVFIGKWFSCFKSKSGKNKLLFLRELYALYPIFVLTVAYALFAVTSSINIGHRHLLVCYPCIFIFCGGLALFYENMKTVMVFLITLLLGWLIFTSIITWPHYLAYFNQFIGGPAKGYNYLVDSSLDWGQDLKGMKNRVANIRKNSPDENIYISYFGTAKLDYRKLDANILPCHFDVPRIPVYTLKAGTYLISATMLQQVYFPKYAQWDEQDENSFSMLSAKVDELKFARKNPDLMKRLIKEKGERFWKRTFLLYDQLRLAKLCNYLRKRKPDDHVGYSILVFKLSKDELDVLGLNLSARARAVLDAERF